MMPSNATKVMAFAVESCIRLGEYYYPSIANGMGSEKAPKKAKAKE
jgi:hypothetical protein